MPLPPHVQQLRAKIGKDLLLLPGVAAIVLNPDSQILLQKRSDFGTWSLIGGILEPGEEPADGVVREVFEETAVRIEPLHVTGVYCTQVIRYPNGDQASYVITTFLCRPVGGPGPRVNDDESLDVRYFPADGLPELRPDHSLRIRHALDQIRTGDARAHFLRKSTNPDQQ